MEKAVQKLIRRMLESVGIVVEYHRGEDFFPLSCWLGATAFKILDQNNSRLIWGDRDYLIPVANLKLNGNLIVPDYGDWIRETFIDGTIRTFELSAPQGEQAFRYSDHEKMIYRIHTKEININAS